MEVNEASADNKEVKENHGFSDWWFQPNGLYRYLVSQHGDGSNLVYYL